ncbi:hypothetical protein EPD60_07520 [Flaviaesturariibacter flavus]|uniref:Uncharacterized protein n=1 Tax=Flaviaesturariibacter flavus TaxID=2502780 RepID=A0A4V2NWA1_9BACT|nr:hypothetical protein [Flaviaesturariibacter flavus]TCJ16582.1 hypothetical protein EPD60_07520 [Flaviaesturariibacter flavus]
MAANLEQIISELKKYCSEQNTLIFPGRIYAPDLIDCTWEGENTEDWRKFIEIAQRCGTPMLHLEVEHFDYDADDIDQIVEDSPDDEDLTPELIEKAKVSNGKPYSFELSFFHNSVLYKYEAENELAEIVKTLLDAEFGDEDNSENQAESEESRSWRQEIETLVEEVLNHPEYREKMKFPDRSRFVLSFLQNQKGKSYDIAFNVFRMAERQYPERVLPIVKKELETKLVDLRKKEPKLTKLKAQSILGITKTDLEAIWYTEAKAAENSLFSN